jgi:hypothetical protein
MNREMAIIDGANAVYLEAPQVRRPNIKNIAAIARAVEASGRDVVIVIDPSIRSVLADADEFERLMSDPRITTVPPGEDTSRFVLETAARLDAVIVSNYTYAEYYEFYPWVEERRIPVAAVNGSVLLLDSKLKRAG